MIKYFVPALVSLLVSTNCSALAEHVENGNSDSGSVSQVAKEPSEHPHGKSRSSVHRRFDLACDEIHCGKINSAHKHLLALANKGHAKSQTLVGVMYRDGVGVEKDLRQAALWLEKAAQQGLREAENELGHLYLSTEASVHNPAKAEQWLTRAAEHGVVEAQRDLGLLYMRGDLVGVDHEKAVIWLRRAAAQGSEEAQKALAALPGGEQLEDAAAQGQAALSQNGKDVSQGMNNIETSWEGFADLTKSMRSITKPDNQF
jgi:TPR repeat protein